MGQAFSKALGEGRGIRRFASIIVPMDESRSEMVIDVGGRPYLVFEGDFSGPIEGVIEPWLIRHFLRALSRMQRSRICKDIWFFRSS